MLQEEIVHILFFMTIDMIYYIHYIIFQAIKLNCYPHICIYYIVIFAHIFSNFRLSKDIYLELYECIKVKDNPT